MKASGQTELLERGAARGFTAARPVPEPDQMSDQPQLQRGDVVIHPRRPEWGRGVVKEASRITYRGAPAQRVAVQFPNKGRVVINTAVAPLLPDQGGPEPAAEPETRSSSSTRFTSNQTTPRTMTHQSSTAHTDAGWLDELEQKRRRGPAALAELPEAMTDPFLSLRRRLHATLESFRFSLEPRSLIDWAVAQTGLDDPLSQYTRHELEEAFAQFRRQRDQHLQSLVRAIKQKGESQLLNEALQSTTHRDARHALTRHMR